MRISDWSSDVCSSDLLSGYPHPLYDEALPGWKRVERMAHADGGRERTECLWINPAAVARLDRETLAHPRLIQAQTHGRRQKPARRHGRSDVRPEHRGAEIGRAACRKRGGHTE